ncbi:MAG: esterase family protein [Chloroflexi bacterium]|nr:esterase family protein [Chloroflexota bacterium]
MTTHPLLEQAQLHGTPLIEGDRVTFVWKGATAPQLTSDFNGWGDDSAGAAQLQQIADGVWTYQTTLPADAYIEYVFTTDPDDEDKRVLDPFNRRQVSNGLNRNNNYFSMPSRSANLMVEFMSNTAQGSVTRHAIYHPFLLSGERRDIWLYQPPTDAPAPLLVVFDGKDYLRRANITQILANLMAMGRIKPVALALVDNARAHRYLEYNASDTVLAQITELVMPLAYNNLNLIDHDANPGSWAVLGASMGGLMALYAGLRLPHIFGKVICQSGAFQLDLTDHRPVIEQLVNVLPRPGLKVWQDVGTLEFLRDQNQRMNALLGSKGYDVTYREFNAGHNWTAWRDMLPAAFTTLFSA